LILHHARRLAVTIAGALALAAGPALGAPAGQGPAPRLNVRCTGSGPATVVLFAGGGDALATWGPLQRALSGSARVCAYDRSGVAGTPVATGPQTFAQMAGALHRALIDRGIGGPLILAGHSIGGAVAVAYAARYRTDARSLVLLDATPPAFVGQALRLIPASATGPAAETRGQLASILDWRANPEHGDGRRGFAQLRALRSLGSLRLLVLSHGDRFLEGLPTYGVALERLWQQGQRHWATLSTEARLQVVARSGHYVYRDRPALVRRALEAEIHAVGSEASGARPGPSQPAGP
jgi:pimeloyl-ACP methyl ester carboxylesterase